MLARPDISSDFARHTVETRFEDLPNGATERAKQSILDTLGVIIAASSLEPAVMPALEIATESGGREEATVFGLGIKTPAVNAAFANGLMAHCLDFDDHAPEGHHPSSSIVPTTFALAERKGGISGKEMLVATAVGQDIFLRLRRNVGWRQDWHLTTVIGTFSAAAAGGRVLGLNEAQIVSALGVAGVQASGTLEMAYGVGSDIRGMYAGFVSKAATLSALFAERGIKGPTTAFEGKAGLFNSYFDGKYDREKMLAHLGQDYTGDSLLYKAWPSCGVTHSFIQATLKVMKANAIKAEDIAKITVYCGDFQYQLCTPLETRRAPKVPVDAKFSIPYCIGLAATQGKVGLSDFTIEGLNNPAARQIAALVEPVRDENSNWAGKLPYGRMDMLLKDGRSFTSIGDDVPGEAENPMDWDYLSRKFREAASFSKAPLQSSAIIEAEEMIKNLEQVADVRDVVRLLTGGQR